MEVEGGFRGELWVVLYRGEFLEGWIDLSNFVINVRIYLKVC